MLRIRSKRLLSGVSAIAVIAAGSGVAFADPTYTGPGFFPAITNDQTATVTISGGAVIGANGSGVSFFNNLTMGGAGDKLRVTSSVLVGGIRNDGTMLSTDEDAIDINDSVIASGGILNNGLLQGGTGDSGIEIYDSTVIGNIVNAAGATIRGDAAGIFAGGNTVIVGSILNSGSILGSGALADGIQLSDANLDFIGNITNNAGGVITSNGNNRAALNLGYPNQISSFIGNISNSGTMQGLGGGTGVYVNAGAFVGNITNNSGGTIQALGAGSFGLYINGNLTGTINNASGALIQASSDALTVASAAFTGDVVNGGRIISTGNKAVVIGGTTFTGNFTNNAGGTIQAFDTAILINATTFQGNFLNSGVINATLVSEGVIVTSATFQGNFTNSGTVHADGDGVVISSAAFNGNFLNSGLIDSDNDVGVRLNGTAFTGNFTNDTGGTIRASDTGVVISTTTFQGAFTNNGLIDATASRDGVIISSTTFTGNFTNNGSIVGDADGVLFSGTTFAGNVINNLYMTSPEDTLRVNGGTTITGSITNAVNGRLISTGEDAVDINGIANGLVNAGSIVGLRNAIDVDGTVGTISNSGTIIGETQGAIDLSGANALTTLTQTAGLIRGRTTGGTILYALQLNNGVADTFTGSGGTLDGNVVGGGGDELNSDTTSTFAFLRGTASTLSEINMSGSGTFLLGAASRGDTGGEGVTVNTTTNLFFTGKGRIYVDDNTTVGLTNQYNQGPNNTVEFYLTSDTATHGQINAGGEGLFLDGNIAAFVNGTTFGSAGGDTFTYEDVMTGGVSGTFDNAGDIITNTLFFEGEALVHAADVDIVLHRLDFSDALVLPGMTANQSSVAGALDNIYDLGPGAGGYGTDFAALFDYLLSLGVGDEALALAIFNEIGGAEHAQLQQTTLDILNPFNTSMGQRLDAAKTTQGNYGFASFGGSSQYAAASAIMTDAASGAARGGSGVSLWARGFGQVLDVEGDLEAPGYDQDTAGAMGGIDFLVGQNSIVGLAAGWSTTDVDFNTPGDNADVDSFQVGAYGSAGFGRFYIDAELAGAFHDLTTTRTLNLPNPPGGSVAGADYDARSLSAAAEFGAVWRSGNFIFQPNAGLAFTDVDTDTFIESGAGDFNLIVNGSDAQSLASTVGARLATQFKAGGMSIMPELSAAWRHEFEDDRQSFSAAFPDDPSSTFTIISSGISEDSALIGAGVTAGLSRSVELFVNYNGLINSDVDVHNGSAGLRATW